MLLIVDGPARQSREKALAKQRLTFHRRYERDYVSNHMIANLQFVKHKSFDRVLRTVS